MKTIAAVPESLTQDQYTSLIESVGFVAKDLRSLEFRTDGIYANVIERNERGFAVLDRDADEVVTKVFIPVRDD